MLVLEKSPIYQEILEKGLERGLEQGMEQGLEQGLEQSILRVLQTRFGNLPVIIVDTLPELTAADLDTLLDAALLSPDLDTFIQEMETTG